MENEKIKSKKKIFIIVAIVILSLILLIPRPIRYKDGGTVDYHAILYSVTKSKKLTPIDWYDFPPKEKSTEHGTIVRILGIEVYNSVEN